VTLGLSLALVAPAAAQSPGDEGPAPVGRRPAQQPFAEEEPPADEEADQERSRRGRGERSAEDEERGDRGSRGGFGGFRRPNPMFEAIDANGDGSINNTELRKAIAALKKLDADGDGNITLAEASPQGGPGGRGGFGGPFGGGDPEQMINGMIQQMDRNRDGQIGLDEVQDERSLQFLSRFRDINGDGKLNRQELAAGMEQMRGQFGGGRGFGGGGFDSRQMTERMMANDQNGDGKLQEDEVPEQFRGMLRGADQNNDGAIDAREMEESSRRMGERFRGGGGRGFGRGGDNDDAEGGDEGERRGRRRPEAEQ
jgi:Ca2+-binding EF-hand superfamily protein